MRPSDSRDPLTPYRRAAARHGGGFQSLLWADAESQRVRFDALRRAVERTFGGRNIWPTLRLLDAGCGRADFADHLAAADCRPGSYVGIEAVPALAAAARAKGVEVIEADFLARPAAFADAGADVICFSGSLNTMGEGGLLSVPRRRMGCGARGHRLQLFGLPRPRRERLSDVARPVGGARLRPPHRRSRRDGGGARRLFGRRRHGGRPTVSVGRVLRCIECGRVAGSRTEFLRTRMRVLRTRMRVLRTRMRVLRTRMRVLRTRMRVLRTRMRVLRTRMRVVRTRMRVLRTRMRVLRTRMKVLRTRMSVLRARMSVLRARMKILRTRTTSPRTPRLPEQAGV